MPIAENFTSVFSHERRIDFTQCLPNGFLRLTDLCNMLQLAAGEHAELGGIAFSDMQAHGQAWVLSRMRVEILQLPKWKDVVTIKTWIVNLENSRSVRALEMYLGDLKIVSCETFWAVFNTKTRRPEALALPTDHFEKFEQNHSTQERTSKVDLTQLSNKLADHKVLLSDLDIVNHANNVKYLEWCLDYFDAKTLLKNQVKAIDMNFMKELVLGDEVEISSDANSETFGILKDGKACFGLRISL
ncbi:acyl-[acyl-carrier-protein] thioesterase [Flavobacterium sp. MAH-1]|uniref:Acyl-[acyl-carrier-protein] thioesterase n=1 Tax=Flavobacterium agri TaxID=2743471 RepID=A0A7Y8Y475_9FLAO|nr:acyl-ACP thioesterase domain-containing protein [Flavobacterium agri]NUY82275.1 acyl-[acyl-carrier-protein] thioesterase [Flavobacterium agri]NYA72299.1 acyl-[acyl-carrier-protein] thioesterase [Flavobacterium agri]